MGDPMSPDTGGITPPESCAPTLEGNHTSRITSAHATRDGCLAAPCSPVAFGVVPDATTPPSTAQMLPRPPTEVAVVLGLHGSQEPEACLDVVDHGAGVEVGVGVLRGTRGLAHFGLSMDPAASSPPYEGMEHVGAVAQKARSRVAMPQGEHARGMFQCV